jgi:hypothetical protein
MKSKSKIYGIEIKFLEFLGTGQFPPFTAIME